MSYIKAYLVSLYQIASMLSLFFMVASTLDGNYWAFYISYVAMVGAISGPLSIMFGFEK